MNGCVLGCNGVVGSIDGDDGNVGVIFNIGIFGFCIGVGLGELVGVGLGELVGVGLGELVGAGLGEMVGCGIGAGLGLGVCVIGLYFNESVIN
jgi:hypothetical protein